MKNIFQYKGYMGSLEVSLEDSCLHGKLLYVSDLVTYEANSVDELRTEFESAVDDYLETCKAENREPAKPLSGTLNVRLGQDLHKQVALAAGKLGVSINEYIKSSIEIAIKEQVYTTLISTNFDDGIALGMFNIETKADTSNLIPGVQQWRHLPSQSSSKMRN